MSIKQVGVVGAGTMGNGIAQVCAAGLDVAMVDILSEAVEKGQATEADKVAILGRIRATTTYADLARSDLVI